MERKNLLFKQEGKGPRTPEPLFKQNTSFLLTNQPVDSLLPDIEMNSSIFG
ncbi:hypothetical protein JCM9157_4837 [Halalkalibacter akibai JCM 9157]|uniref:Uncharacterized protein n=1 Tax=Halalkalibacter akibai (strain ATCC 43226 / DSM 21942 / CIP 109018 / JCM 9157 / 1139) TaxID=1236973 RepID=W4R0V4_HALA3|nr:hypothetical protein JCM9157_4837 [Halalkalibacter akibai JCM 9157]